MNEKLNQAAEETKQFLLNDLWKQIKENWRLILVAAIVVAISLNSFWSDKSANPNSEGALSSPSQNEQNQGDNQNNSQQAQNDQATPTPTPTPSASPEPKVETPSDNGDVVTKTAKKGEGVTHLARQAVKEYLESTGTKLSSEQKIYAEDYIKQQTGSKNLEIGQTIKFNKSLIKTSVEKAGSLSETQIKNLSKFVPLVQNL